MHLDENQYLITDRKAARLSQIYILAFSRREMMADSQYPETSLFFITVPPFVEIYISYWYSEPNTA
jgi:hypothetical protein